MVGGCGRPLANVWIRFISRSRKSATATGQDQCCIPQAPYWNTQYSAIGHANMTREWTLDLDNPWAEQYLARPESGLRCSNTWQPRPPPRRSPLLTGLTSSASQIQSVRCSVPLHAASTAQRRCQRGGNSITVHQIGVAHQHRRRPAVKLSPNPESYILVSTYLHSNNELFWCFM